jgi:VanZ family protein
LAFWLFWPALAVVVWGELKPQPLPLEVETPDKLLHFLAYFGLAAIAAAAFARRRAVLFALLGLVALGGALEILQGLTGRDAEWLDEAANALGASAGALAGLLFVRLVGQTPSGRS